ncbi:hypothetical protein AB0M95_34275 [Sphaerisporangium sp. NPDC051017]|uniref:hypothetical protein n=1 Tax=Sphaerisporangium sp. NPDC051017 TaxID=3154636 RepID=UPI00341A8BC7
MQARNTFRLASEKDRSALQRQPKPIYTAVSAPPGPRWSSSPTIRLSYDSSIG